MTTSPTPSESLVSPSPAPLTSPHPSDESQAATAKISISFVSVSALSLLARLPSSHPQYIFCSGIIDPPDLQRSPRIHEPVDSPGLDPAVGYRIRQVPITHPRSLSPVFGRLHQTKCRCSSPLSPVRSQHRPRRSHHPSI